MIIPAYCPTCGAVFGSGISVSDASNVFMDGNIAGPCPNGHMGLVADGTFDVVNEVLQIRQSGFVTDAIKARIQNLAQEAIEGKKPADKVLDEILSILPKESAAAVKKLGINNPLSIIIIILALLLPAAGIYTAFKPSAPQAAPIVNNYVTVNNNGAPGGGGNKPVVHSSGKRTGAREQMKAEKKQLAAQAKAQAHHEDACPPKRPKVRPPKNYQRHH